MQLSDWRTGKEHVTCCAPVLVEVERELHPRSKAYLPTHLLLTSLVPIAWTQTWVSQPNHVQPWQVALMMKNKWELLHPWHGKSGSQADTKLILHCIKPSRHYTLLSLHVTQLLFLVIACFYSIPCQWVWVMTGTTKVRKYIYVHNTAKLLQMRESALSLKIQMSTNIWDMLVWVLRAFWLDKRAWWGSYS